jgi:chlorobactene glucosyltransferase
VTPETGRSLSLVIPARNESHQIETVVRSVLASTYTPLQVIVVDDRSTDDTADRVRAIARTDARLVLLQGRDLPAGWYGKPWACQQGADASTSDLIVFTDADTTHHPELLARAAAMLQRTNADLLTVAPRQVILSFWERVVMPQVWVLLGTRYHPDTVNRATRARDAVANGQFMMFQRSSYLAVGGHAAVKGEVVEDMAMAQEVVRQKRKLYFVFAYDYMQTRMYQNLGQLMEGWSKNLFIGARLSFREEPLLRLLSPLMIISGALFRIAPLVVLAGALLGFVPSLLWPAVAASLSTLAFWSLIAFGMQAPMWYGFLYPLGAVMVIAIMVRSAWRGTRRVEWRGRVYNEATGDVTESASPSAPAPE